MILLCFNKKTVETVSLKLSCSCDIFMHEFLFVETNEHIFGSFCFIITQDIAKEWLAMATKTLTKYQSN